MIDDKELIRRALMGDQEAQKECTKNEIVLTCPCCKSDAELVTKTACFTGEPEQEFHVVRCKSCFLQSGLYTSKIAALNKWNTRPAPPIGKCGECKYSREPTKQDYEELDRYSLMHKDACVCTYDEPKEVWKFDFCSSFKPREE